MEKSVGAFLLITLVGSVVGYPNGVPATASVCKQMIPGHGAKPQNSAAPCSLSTSTSSVKGGSQLEVTITAADAANAFKGFYIQARDTQNVPIGSFVTNKETNVHSCGGIRANAAHHVSKEPKESIALVWKAPASYSGPVTFTATCLKDFNTFWTQVKSPAVTVEKADSSEVRPLSSLPYSKVVVGNRRHEVFESLRIDDKQPRIMNRRPYGGSKKQPNKQHQSMRPYASGQTSNESIATTSNLRQAIHSNPYEIPEGLLSFQSLSGDSPGVPVPQNIPYSFGNGLSVVKKNSPHPQSVGIPSNYPSQVFQSLPHHTYRPNVISPGTGYESPYYQPEKGPQEYYSTVKSTFQSSTYLPTTSPTRPEQTPHYQYGHRDTGRDKLVSPKPQFGFRPSYSPFPDPEASYRQQKVYRPSSHEGKIITAPQLLSHRPLMDQPDRHEFWRQHQAVNLPSMGYLVYNPRRGPPFYILPAEEFPARSLNHHGDKSIPLEPRSSQDNPRVSLIGA